MNEKLPLEDSKISDSKAKHQNLVSNQKLNSSDQKYHQIAATIRTLPEMPESAKNIAKSYMDQILQSNDQEIQTVTKHSTLLNEDKRYENLGAKLLSGIKSIGGGQGTSGIQSQLSRNLNNGTDQFSMNRSLSLKSLNNNQSKKKLDTLDTLDEEVPPKMSARIKEITANHFINKDKISKTFNNQNFIADTLSKQTNSNGYLNLDAIKGKNIIITSSQAVLTNKLSPLPEKYHQHLPNIIKKKVSEATSTSFNFNQNANGINRNKSTNELKSLEQIQNFMRPDVSYLGEIKNQSKEQLPTVLTTGNRGQDQLLEALGMKNMGKSLINLPQTIEELNEILLDYDKKKQKQLGNNRYENEEKLLDKYLQENLSSLDTIHEDHSSTDVLLPGISLKQFKNDLGISQSRFLSNQLGTQKQSLGTTSPFNIQNKKTKSPVIASIDKQPPKIETKPEKLILVNEKVMKRYGKDAFFNTSIDKFQDQHASVKRSDQSNIVDQSLITANPNKTLPSKNITMSQQLLNNSKFQSLQASWLNEEKSQERSQIQYNDYKDSSFSPINIKTHKHINNNTLITSIVQTNNSGNHGNPSSRQDAILLIVWFEKMLLQVQKEQNKPGQDPESESRHQAMLQLIMNICVKELSRQVSVQCLERGLILQKVFQSYAKLINLINNDNKQKRWKHKREMAEKLDKYITIQEGQIKGYQDKIYQQQLNEAVLGNDLNDCLTRLNQANVLISKFKKKCWNLQKDYEVNQRKLKLLEKENGILKQKVEDLSEKLGEELSEIDDGERQRMLLQIDQEMADSQIEKDLLKDDKGETMEDTVEIDQIPDRDIIQEDDKATDMFDFERYLRSVDLWKYQENETQTDRVFKKHVKLGVKPEKLGILKDKETFIDMRMFYGDQQTIQIRGGGAQDLLPRDSIKVEDQDQNLQEDDSEFFDDSDSDGDFLNVKNQNDSSIDNDETLKELGLMNDQIVIQDNSGKNDGFMTLDLTQLRDERKGSFQGDFTVINHLNENDTRMLPQYGTGQVEQIITKPSKKHDFALTDRQNEQIKKQGKDIAIGNDSQNMSNQDGFDDQKDKIQNAQKLKRQRRKQRQNTLMQIFAERIKQRLKELINSEDVQKIKEENEQFANLLISDLKNTQKEVKQMNNEYHKKDKQVKFQLKLNIKNEKELKEAIEQIDQLEMDNYNLREQLNEIVKYFEDYEGALQDVLKLLDRDSMGQMTINDLKNKLNQLTDKVFQAKKKAYVQLNGEDDKTYITNDQINTTMIDENMKQDGLNNDDAASSLNQTGQNFNQKNKNLMPNANSKLKKRVTNVTGQDKLDAKQVQEMMRKRAITRFQMFKVGNRKKSPNKSKGTHPSIIILKKMQQKDVKKIKDIMPRKMLLRVIWQIYQERGPYDLNALNQQQVNITNFANMQGPSSTQQNFANDKTQLQQTQHSFTGANQNTNQQVPIYEWVYENFMQKYGLKNVAEKKFNQLIGSCIIMKEQLPRIRLFARFMEVYDELSPTDYNRYLEINELFQQQILNFKIDDDSEQVLLPVNRALDYYRLKFESKFTGHAFTQRLQKIDKMKMPVGIEEARAQKHLKNIREAVDFDKFVEFVLDSYNFLQEERENQIRDIFLAADLNGDDLLSFNEFEMLMKVFQYKSQNDIWKLFDEYSTLEQDPQNRNVKYLNLDQFIQLCQDKDYFTTRVQQNFCLSKHIEKDFKLLNDNMSQTVLLFKARLREIDMLEDFDSLEIIENFQNSIKFPFSDRVGWLCYRIVEEYFKRLYAKKLSQKYMPIDIKTMGIKLRPSQTIFNMIPANLYDTL